MTPERTFSIRQRISATAYSDGMLDLQRGDRLFAEPRTLTVIAFVTAPFKGRATLQVQVTSQEWPHSGTPAGHHFATDVLHGDALKEGRDIRLQLPNRNGLRRFLRLRYLVDGRFESGSLSTYLQS